MAARVLRVSILPLLNGISSFGWNVAVSTPRSSGKSVLLDRKKMVLCAGCHLNHHCKLGYECQLQRLLSFHHNLDIGQLLHLPKIVANSIP